MPGPRRLKLPEDRGELHPEHGNVEIRFTNGQGETEVWLLQAGNMAFINPDTILMAFIDTGADLQKSQQLEHINRLLKHVQWHHDRLEPRYTTHSGGQNICTYAHREAEGMAQT